MQTTDPNIGHDTETTAAASTTAALAEALARSGHRWGVAGRDLPQLRERTGAEAVADAAREVVGLGGEVLMLSSPRQASPTLDPGELRAAGAEAARLGVEVRSGLGAVHPGRYDPAATAAALEAGETLGVAAYHITFGMIPDRYATSPSWAEQLAAAAGPIRELVDRAGRPVVMRTHEDMTTAELTRLLATVDRDALRVGFSPVNVVTRLEEPFAAFGRVAERVETLHLDDCRIARTSTGLTRRLCRLGEGMVPWPAVLARTAASEADTVAILDIAQAEFDMPFYDPAWRAYEPQLDVAELAGLLASVTDPDPGPVHFDARGEHGRRLLASAARIRAGEGVPG